MASGLFEFGYISLKTGETDEVLQAVRCCFKTSLEYIFGLI
ncbi:hypothetical protein DSUL_20302 [Desulfovibrionales bacterium]